MPEVMQFFNLPHLWLCLAAIGCALSSYMLLRATKERLALLLLWLSAFFMGSFMALLDPFLHNWDERFHALVAKNMVAAPFKPKLRVNPIIAYDKFDWCCNHIWLHKQPLFLWQMALSIKLFGASEFSARLPSVVMGAFMVVLVYGIAKMALGSLRAAFFAAVLMSFCNYHLELISGYNGTDHNNIAFVFYVLASLWAYLRYTSNKKLSFVLLVGIFAGCAVLNKWLVGLVVYSAWGINIILGARGSEGRKEALHLLLALVTSCAIFLPWQFYIFHAFPQEAAYEFAFNSRHITEVIEGHKGSIFFYGRMLPVYFGWLAPILIPYGCYRLCVAGRSGAANKKVKVALFVIAGLITVFFSLVVKTKWPPYLFPAVPIGFIFIAAGVQGIKRKLEGMPFIWGAIALGCLALLFNPLRIAQQHNPGIPGRAARVHNTAIYKQLNQILPTNVKLVLNTNSFEDLDAMYYNSGLNIYSWMLTPATIDSLERAKVPFAVFKAHGQYGVPENVMKYPLVYVIDEDLE